MNTNIHITCSDRKVTAKTLTALGEVLFPAVEMLEKVCDARPSFDPKDQLSWILDVEGPDWDYTAEGEVDWVRNTEILGSQGVQFHCERMTVDGTHRTPPNEQMMLLLARQLEN